jgi:hypothetical protein
MESVKTPAVKMEKRRFRLREHPWLALLAVMLTAVFSVFLSGTVIFGLIGLPDDSPPVQFTQGIAHQVTYEKSFEYAKRNGWSGML